MSKCRGSCKKSGRKWRINMKDINHRSTSSINSVISTNYSSQIDLLYSVGGWVGLLHSPGGTSRELWLQMWRLVVGEYVPSHRTCITFCFKLSISVCNVDVRLRKCWGHTDLHKELRRIWIVKYSEYGLLCILLKMELGCEVYHALNTHVISYPHYRL